MSVGSVSAGSVQSFCATAIGLGAPAGLLSDCSGGEIAAGLAGGILVAAGITTAVVRCLRPSNRFAYSAAQAMELTTGPHTKSRQSVGQAPDLATALRERQCIHEIPVITSVPADLRMAGRGDVFIEGDSIREALQPDPARMADARRRARALLGAVQAAEAQRGVVQSEVSFPSVDGIYVAEYMPGKAGTKFIRPSITVTGIGYRGDDIVQAIADQHALTLVPDGPGVYRDYGNDIKFMITSGGEGYSVVITIMNPTDAVADERDNVAFMNIKERMGLVNNE